ncbi:putative oxidoreductase C-terminal domain-containing protein [Chryseolinea lacunae]|uniref:Gfo/Idh/MocA family oxidoreductase n=1 Tax=Chryseolinea lacunae TaxID=2801331 RepID=A0ABS1KLU6_9BACT|nr:Gfo/Idh/MocA family oxidoreductase [Chryseolinea lacunae]
MKHVLTVPFMLAAALSFAQPNPATTPVVKLITLDPGHFHAALVQKSMYPQVDSVVHVYAPEGNDVALHLQRIEAFNKRALAPTHWKEQVYTAPDYFEKMLAEKAGNVVVIAGNNKLKTEYIDRSLKAGFHVLADKPMAINHDGFERLKKAFETARQQKHLLYDIMTERYEITTLLQKELSLLPDVFGTLEKGTIDNPAVTKESVHHFYKYVAGSVLTRPAWFMDVSQAGEGIADVTTHLVDLVQWECFPNQTLDYTKDIKVLKGTRWPTEMTLHQFTAITKQNAFPDYLKKDIVRDSVLNVFCNGAINYTLKGVHAKVSVTWAYQAKVGGDTHYSIMRGTKANLVIRQGEAQKFSPTLYIEPIKTNANYEASVLQQFKKLEAKFPGIALQKSENGWEVIIPEKYKEGHEAHFARVTEKFLEYLRDNTMPAWEVPNMIAKYYTTTRALDMARSGK